MLDWKQRHGDLKFPGSIQIDGATEDETVFLNDFEWRALNHLLDAATNKAHGSNDYYTRKAQILRAFYNTLPKGKH